MVRLWPPRVGVALFHRGGCLGTPGFALCAIAAFLTIYGVVCWQQYGVLAMKDRLATMGIWTGALMAMIPLLAVILYVIVKGAAVASADFPHFFVAIIFSRMYLFLVYMSFVLSFLSFTLAI